MIKKADRRDLVQFSSMMSVFRYNFREVIEIVTTAHAMKGPEGMKEDEISSIVNVKCTIDKTYTPNVTDKVTALFFKFLTCIVGCFYCCNSYFILLPISVFDIDFSNIIPSIYLMAP